MQEIEGRRIEDPISGLLLDQGEIPIKPKHPFLDKLSAISTETKTLIIFSLIVGALGLVVFAGRLKNSLSRLPKSISDSVDNFKESLGLKHWNDFEE